MATTLSRAEVRRSCQKRQKEKFQNPIKGMAIVVAETHEELFCAWKLEKYLNRAEPQRGGAGPIQVISQMPVVVHMKRQKVITGGLFEF